MGLELELCFNCDQPTDRAGRLDDSFVCNSCDNVFCEEHFSIETDLCSTCKKKEAKQQWDGIDNANN